MTSPVTVTPPIIYALFALVLAALSPIAWSQQPAADSSGKTKDVPLQLDVFTVATSKDEGYLSQNTLSGNRVSANLMKVPQTIQIVNQQLIEDLNVLEDLMPAMELATGSIVRRSFNPGDDQFLWGFRVSSTLRDGLPTFSNAVTSSYDVERVEIVKGPSAMIFGQFSSVGGIVNYVTKKPSKTPSYFLKASVGSFDYRSLEFHARGPITSKLRYRADIGALDEGYSSRKFAFVENQFIGAAVDYDLGPASRVSMDYSFYTLDTLRPLTMMDPRINGKVLEAPDNFSLNEPWAHHPTEQHRASATFTTILGTDFTSRTLFFYSNARNDWLRDQMNSLDVVNQTGRKISQDFHVSNHTLTLVSDFVKEMKTGAVDHRLNFGFDIRNEVLASNQTNYLLTNTYNYRNPTYTTEPTTGKPIFGARTNSLVHGRFAGIYAMDQLSVLNERFSVVAGVRFNDQFSQSGDRLPSGSPSAVTNENYTAPRYGVIVRPFESLTGYYNYSESFSFNTGVDYRSRPLVPSVGKNKEFGVKFMLVDDAKWSAHASLTYFDLQLTNVTLTFTQGPGDPNPGTQGIRQSGQQTNKGYDLYLNLHRKFEMANLSAIITAYHGDIRDQFNRKPVFAVNNTHSFLGTVEVKSGRLAGFNVGGGFVYKGRRVGPNLPSGATTYFEPYTVSRAMLGYKWRRYQFQLNVENLSDDKYIIGSETALFVYTDPGRSIKFSTGYRF